MNRVPAPSQEPVVVNSGPGWKEIVYGPLQNEQPVVSVCVTAYQHAPFIARCLDSILAQVTRFPFEIRVGEDDSRDGTREICEEYARRYPGQVHLTLHDRTNQISIHGRPTGRFNGFHNLTHSRGRYIALCEGDDFWTDPHKLQKQADFLETHPGCVFAFHNAMKVADDGAELGLALKPKMCRDRSQAEMLSGTWMPTASVVFRRDLIDQLPESFLNVYNADTYLIAFAGQFGEGGYVDVEPSGYRIHAGGIWSHTQQEFRLRSNLHTFETLYDDLPRKFRWEAGYQVVRKQNQLAWHQLTSGHWSAALRQLGHNLAFCGPRMGPFWVAHQCRWFASQLTAPFRKRLSTGNLTTEGAA